MLGEEVLLQPLNGALLAAHQIVGCPGFNVSHSLPAPDALDPAHCFKYAWSCVCELKATGDQRYVDEIQAFREQKLIPEWAAVDIC